MNTAANYLTECVLLWFEEHVMPKERLLTKTIGLLKWCEGFSKPEVLLKGRKGKVIVKVGT